ncbi:duodenase-1-like [Tachyglossus aculeatus]|uniref:duodenase-1-like n=1 Tax=Tachyglossus aculeatus TaxID=9261 RepID=UPI0018F778B3|nr:duodenase-1-like [Tachyglossus aculeatus]
MQLLLLFLWPLLLPPGARGGEIIGGKEAKPHSRPYMAHLNFYKNGNRHCGGFLVRKDFVLTAAHCSGSEMRVTLGAHNIRNREATQQRIPVVQKFSPNYNGHTFADIMLLKLGHAANMTKEVNIIRLPLLAANVKPGVVCSVAGWGMTGVNGPGSRTLQEVQLEVMSPTTCSRLYRNFRSRDQLCVGNPESHKSSFKGDSGGPLVCGKRAQGIVSYGRLDARPPSVFTRVASYLPWIKEILQKN